MPRFECRDGRWNCDSESSVFVTDNTLQDAAEQFAATLDRASGGMPPSERTVVVRAVRWDPVGLVDRGLAAWVEIKVMSRPQMIYTSKRCEKEG